MQKIKMKAYQNYKLRNVVLLLLLLAFACTNKKLSQANSKVDSSSFNKAIIKQSIADKKDSSLKTWDCIRYPKSAKFLDVLREATCITLPVDVDTIGSYSLTRYKFTEPDSLFFALSFKNGFLKRINTVTASSWADADELILHSDANDTTNFTSKDNLIKATPIAIIYETQQFVLLCLKHAGSNVNVLCTFTKNGVYIDGFSATYGMGNNHGGITRNTFINKDVELIITEHSEVRDTDDWYDFLAIYKVEPDGRFKKVKQKVKRGRGNY